MLLEAHEVKVQVFDTILLKQVLSQQMTQIDSCLSKRSWISLIQGRVTCRCRVIANVVGHIEGLLLIAKSVAECMCNAAMVARMISLTTSLTGKLDGSSRVLCGTLGRNFTVLHFDIVVLRSHALVIGTDLRAVSSALLARRLESIRERLNISGSCCIGFALEVKGMRCWRSLGRL